MIVITGGVFSCNVAEYGELRKTGAWSCTSMISIPTLAVAVKLYLGLLSLASIVIL